MATVTHLYSDPNEIYDPANKNCKSLYYELIDKGPTVPFEIGKPLFSATGENAFDIFTKMFGGIGGKEEELIVIHFEAKEDFNGDLSFPVEILTTMNGNFLFVGEMKPHYSTGSKTVVSSFKDDLSNYEDPIQPSNRPGGAFYHNEGQVFIAGVLTFKDSNDCYQFMQTISQTAITAIKTFDVEGKLGEVNTSSPYSGVFSHVGTPEMRKIGGWQGWDIPHPLQKETKKIRALFSFAINVNNDLTPFFKVDLCDEPIPVGSLAVDGVYVDVPTFRRQFSEQMVTFALEFLQA